MMKLMSTVDRIIAVLKEKLKTNDISAVVVLLRQIQRERIPVPVEILKFIIEHVNDTDAVVISQGILTDMASKKDGAMNALIGYMHLETPDRIRWPIVYLVANSSAKQFLAIPSDLFYELLVDPLESIKKAALSMLKKMAENSPARVPSGALSMAILREQNATYREEMLKLSEIANPVSRQATTVTIDTLYLINWLRSYMSLRSNDLHEAIIEIQKRCFDNSQECALISSLIAESCVIDAFLFMMPKRYRGHQIHHFNVASLGLLLLKTYVSGSKTLAEYIAGLKNLTPEEVERAWLISALLHDHAVPFVFLFQVSPVIRDLCKAYPSYVKSLNILKATFENAYQNLFSNELWSIYKEDSEQIRYARLSEKIQQELKQIKCPSESNHSLLFNHGVLGAINLTSRLRSKNDDYVDSNEIVKMAASAIALHSSKLEIRFDKEPIAFLLVLCDEAQEWGREIGFQQRPTVESPSIGIGPFSYVNDKRMFDDELLINFHFMDSRKLKETGWSDELFTESKDFAFPRLKFPDNDFRPRRISYSISKGPQP